MLPNSPSPHDAVESGIEAFDATRGVDSVDRGLGPDSTAPGSGRQLARMTGNASTTDIRWWSATGVGTS